MERVGGHAFRVTRSAPVWGCFFRRPPVVPEVDERVINAQESEQLAEVIVTIN